MQFAADKFDDNNEPPAVEPIFIAGAILLVAVALIVALLVAAG